MNSRIANEALAPLLALAVSHSAELVVISSILAYLEAYAHAITLGIRSQEMTDPTHYLCEPAFDVGVSIGELSREPPIPIVLKQR